MDRMEDVNQNLWKLWNLYKKHFQSTGNRVLYREMWHWGFFRKKKKPFNYDSSFFPILVWRENPNHKQLSRQLKRKRTFIISASLFPLYLVNSWLLPYVEVSVVLTNHISQQLCTMTQYNSARLVRLLSLLWCYKGHSFSHTLVMGL